MKKQKQRKKFSTVGPPPRLRTLGPSWGQERPGLLPSGPQQLYTWTQPFLADGRPPVLSFLQHHSSEAPTSTFPPLSSSSRNLTGDVTPTAIHLLPTGSLLVVLP